VEAELNGARIHYRRSGAGYPVVFLHAGVADSRMWEPQAAGLGTHFDVITPDMRGYGESELPATSWSPTADVLALMDALQIREAPHLVGCSIGGGVAIDFALQHPERVSKLVLVGAGVGGLMVGDPDDPIYAEMIAADEAENLTALRRRYPDREVVPVSAKEIEGIEDLKHALDIRLCEPDLDKIDPAVSSYAEAIGQTRTE